MAEVTLPFVNADDDTIGMTVYSSPNYCSEASHARTVSWRFVVVGGGPR